MKGYAKKRQSSRLTGALSRMDVAVAAATVYKHRRKQTKDKYKKGTKKHCTIHVMHWSKISKNKQKSVGHVITASGRLDK